MKKILLTALLIVALGLPSWAGSGEERHYVNLSFTVWQLENGAAEAASRIDTQIPELLRESWICDFAAFDVTGGQPTTKVVEKDGFRLVMTAEYKAQLTIQVFEKEKELFRFVHNRPSTVDYIFYGSDNKTYMMEVTFTADNYPIGLLSPGILKK